MSKQQPNTDEVREQIRNQYREHTGEELPNHVLENYDEFFALGPTFEDIDRAFEYGRKSAEAEYTTRDVAAVVGVTIVVTAAVSFGVAFAIASSFGMAVAALVSVGVGFVIGGLLSMYG
jgi:hypothetical protein